MTIPARFKHVMVDCETLGVMPNRNPIIQIALVPFCLDTLTIGEGISLGLDYRTQKDRVVDMGTVQWWQSKPQWVKDKISAEMFDGVSTRDKLIQLNNHILKQAIPGEKIIFWSKPSGFDFPFIDGIYRDNLVSSLFPFWLVMDMGSYCMGRLGMDRELYDSLKAERDEATAHDAQSDCIWQLEWLFNVERHVREGIK